VSKANPKTSARALQKAQRADEVLRLRLMGLTLQQAADKVGVSRPQAWQYVRQGLRNLAESSAHTADELRVVEEEKLRQLEVQAKQTLSGKELFDTLLKLHDKRVKMFGIDAPQKVVHTNGIDELAFANGQGGDALERLRTARAEMAELELQQRKDSLVPVEEVRAKFRSLISHLSRAADNLRRKNNTEGLDEINAAIAAMEREAQQTLPQIQ
jgi:transcriptional regulator with XRE-family HTH domain